jgi:hypothetical protein
MSARLLGRANEEASFAEEREWADETDRICKGLAGPMRKPGNRFISGFLGDFAPPYNLLEFR